MARPKPIFPSKMIRIPGELVAPVTSMIAAWMIQKEKILAMKKTKPVSKEKTDDNCK